MLCSDSPLPYPLALRPARAHEACGPGAPVFAAVRAAEAGGTVLWIRPSRAPGRIMPAALARFLPPERLITAEGRDETDLLWMAEEGLRSGAVALVVAEPGRPLGLTEGRRLQLAAEAGRTTGLFLIAEGAGSPAAETRWHCAPVFHPARSNTGDSTLQRWQLIKNKKGTFGNWTLSWDESAHRIRVVSAAGE